ncbi:MAG: AAA family ATPase [Candidatus Hydrogenedentes bacterium]|nr:AAA family ATPase [Candidatus Hydrogenedentota bacterium]
MNQVQTVYRAFSLAPLTPEQESLYVPLDRSRGEMDVVHRLASRIRMAEHSVSQVLAGHKGSGKSTELMRLQVELERQDSGGRYFTVLVKADDDIDRNDVDFPEILIALVRQLAKQLKEREGIQLKPGYFADRWERIKKLLGSEISFEGASLEAGMLKISSTLKSSPDARDDIRKLLEPDTNNWLAAANDVIGQAIAGLSRKGYQGLVVLLDDLEKWSYGPKMTQVAQRQSTSLYTAPPSSPHFNATPSTPYPCLWPTPTTNKPSSPVSTTMSPLSPWSRSQHRHRIPSRTGRDSTGCAT